MSLHHCTAKRSKFSWLPYYTQTIYQTQEVLSNSERKGKRNLPPKYRGRLLAFKAHALISGIKVRRKCKSVTWEVLHGDTKFRTIAAFSSLDSDLTNGMFINFLSLFIRGNGEILCVHFLLLGRYEHINSMDGTTLLFCTKSEA